MRVRRVAEGRQERILRGLVLGVDRDLVLAAEDVGRELGVLAHALKGGVELLELLLNHGASPVAFNAKGYAPIHTLVSSNAKVAYLERHR